MDEVGFMVSDIKVDGTLRVVGIGGWNPLVVSSQRFTLYTRTGQVIPLISGSVPPHFYVGQMALLVYQISKILCLMVALRIRQKLKALALHRVILLSLNLKRS